MQEQDDARTDARSTRSKDRSTRRRPRLLGTAVAVAVVVALALGVLVAAAHDDRQRRVNLFGDSLVLQASPYWIDLMHRAGWDAQQSSYAGTNTCDWFAQMRKVAKQRHPDVVALSFGGNEITKCMHHADGSKLSRTEFFAKFRRDTETAVGIFGDRVRIYLVAPPAMYDGDDRFGPAYRAVAAEHRTVGNVRFVDGGRILTPGRDWRRTLPCLARERCTGPVVNGVRQNVVRAPDKIHFCPLKTALAAKCSGYAPGAYRYALTISDAIRDGER